MQVAEMQSSGIAAQPAPVRAGRAFVESEQRMPGSCRARVGGGGGIVNNASAAKLRAVPKNSARARRHTYQISRSAGLGSGLA